MGMNLLKSIRKSLYKSKQIIGAQKIQVKSAATLEEGKLLLYSLMLLSLDSFRPG
jgi:hypothetical protein